MPNLLIHSMSEFSDIILEALRLADARHGAEVGAEYGGMSARLAEHVAARDGRLTSVAPSPKPEFLNWVAATSRSRAWRRWVACPMSTPG